MPTQSNKPDEKEEWVGVYFRLPADMYEAFKEAVAKAYGMKKGAVGEALRDLVADFIETATLPPNKRQHRILYRIMDKMDEQVPPEYDFTRLQSKAWQVYEDVLRVIWQKTHHYPQFPIKRDEFEAVLGIARGRSRSTIYKWSKALEKAGLITRGNKTVTLHYPVISTVKNLDDMIDRDLTKYILFAMLAPDKSMMRIVYTVPINMNPPHIAVLIVRVTNGEAALDIKDIVPETWFNNFLDNLNTRKRSEVKGALAVIQALILRENWMPANLTAIDGIMKMLSEYYRVPDAGVLIGAPRV